MGYRRRRSLFSRNIGKQHLSVARNRLAAEKIAELFSAWVSRMGHKSQTDIDEQTKNEFGLVAVSEAEFDQVVAQNSFPTA